VSLPSTTMLGVDLTAHDERCLAFKSIDKLRPNEDIDDRTRVMPQCLLYVRCAEDISHLPTVGWVTVPQKLPLISLLLQYGGSYLPSHIVIHTVPRSMCI